MRSLECPLLGGAPTPVVAKAVQRDRVEPRFLGGLAAVEAPSGSQRAFEGVGEDVLRQRSIPGAVHEEGEQRLSVLMEEPLEVVCAHPGE
jgi:hypothetical protein